MVITVDYLATWWKQKSLWNCDNLRSLQGYFATKSWPNLQFKKKKKKGGGGGGGYLSFCQNFFCYAFERLNL